MKNKKILYLVILVLFISCKSNDVEEIITAPQPVLGSEIFLKNVDDSFTFCVIPDTQRYFHNALQNDRHKSYPINHYEIGNRHMQWIAKNSEKNGGDIAFALMAGDIVNNHRWFPSEWKYADKAFSILDDEIPYLLVMGNHDTDDVWPSITNSYNVSGSKNFIKYFGPNSKHFKNKKINGGFYKKGSSSWQIFNGAGTNFLVIGLEFEPTDSVLSWAQQVINDHPTLPVILITHSYIDIYNELPVEYEKYQESKKIPKDLIEEIELLKNQKGKALLTSMHNHNPNSDHNSGKDIFNKFVKVNKNIFLVLCGHCFDGNEGENHRIDFNDEGYPVYSFLADYQGRNQLYKVFNMKQKTKASGDGWLRLMTMDMKNKTLHIQTYSTEFHCFEKDSDSEFFIQFDWDWDERFSN